jgi:hypothetical protein
VLLYPWKKGTEEVLHLVRLLDQYLAGVSGRWSIHNTCKEKAFIEISNGHHVVRQYALVGAQIANSHNGRYQSRIDKDVIEVAKCGSVPDW